MMFKSACKNQAISSYFKKINLLFLSLIAFSSFIMLYHLGNNSLHTVDEALYATISREMLITGDWITPHLKGKPYFNKPPLKFWLTAVSFRFFGTSEWVVRFWSAASAVACIIFTFLLAKELFGTKEALWSGFSLATCFHFIYEHCAKTGEMDAILLFFLVSSLYFLIRSEKNPRLLPISLFIMGLGSLTKNFAGFLPLGIGFLYLSVTGKWGKYSASEIIRSVLLFLVISSGWVIAMILLHRIAFVNEFFSHQVYERATSMKYFPGVGKAQSLAGGMFFIGKNILKGFYPWSLLLLPSLIWSFFQIPQWRKDSRILPVLWFVSFGIILLFLKNKLPWYVLPMYPALSILVGKFFGDAFSGARISWKNMLSCVILFCGLFFLIPNHTYNPFVSKVKGSGISILILNPNLAFAFLLAGCSIVIWIFAARKSPRLANYSMVALVSVYAAAFVILPLRFASHKSEIKKLTTAIAQHTQTSKQTLYFWGIPRNVFIPPYPLWKPAKIARWYFDIMPNTKISFLYSKQEICRKLRVGRDCLFLMPRRYYRQIKFTCPHRVLTARRVRGNTYILVSPVGK